jgi:hypothetical protein
MMKYLEYLFPRVLFGGHSLEPCAVCMVAIGLFACGCDRKSEPVEPPCETQSAEARVEGVYKTPEAVFKAWKHAIEKDDSALFLGCYSREDEKWHPYLLLCLTSTREGIYIRDVMRRRFGEDAWEEFNTRIEPRLLLNPITDSRIQTELVAREDGSFLVVRKGESLIDRTPVLSIVPYEGLYVASLGISGSVKALDDWVNPQLQGLRKLYKVVESAPSLDELARLYIQVYNEEHDRIRGK